MKIEKLKITDRDFDINLTFYNFLKKITQAKFSDGQINELLTIYYSNSDLTADGIKDQFYAYIDKEIRRGDTSNISNAIADISSENIDIFVFALKLNLVKDLLLQEAKVFQIMKAEKLEGLNKLSLAYDSVSTQVAYATRISGALLSLAFFQKLDKRKLNLLSDSAESFIKSLALSYKTLKDRGVESNQIFMLLFSESINQSITSSAGVSYEDRIKSVLISIGISAEAIKKIHDETDSSTEFDFFFEWRGKRYGIGAKRTLRERYKQFIKTAYMSPAEITMVEVTLGTDLRENIAKAIRDHGVYLFVADEVYFSRAYLQEMDGVFPASKLTLDVLEGLS